MKFLKPTTKVVLILLALLIIAAFCYKRYAAPDYQGTKELYGLSDSTSVFFDTHGIPHIYASNEEDAIRALGYVHAQDRLFQMEVLRRIAAGRLSEIFGTKTLKADTFFAGTGIDESSREAVRNIDKRSREYQLAQAYLAGINSFMDKGPLPPEFLLLGIKPTHFTLEDVYNVYGYMSFSFAMAHRTDPLLSWIKDNLGEAWLKDLGVGTNLNTTRIMSQQGKERFDAIALSISGILDTTPAPSFIGSNSWVVAPQKSATGKVLFANDPHIGYSQPGTWYEAHISVPGYEVYGFYLAGSPFPLLGHNRKYAYGLTMFENDDIDFFRETVIPGDANTYSTPDGIRKFENYNRTIKIKDSADVTLNVRKSVHGPVMNGLIDGLEGQAPLSMSWTYLQKPLKLLSAVYGISHASDVNSFRSAVSLIAAPGLNVMYADARGNIGWFASGSLYKVPAGVNTSLILDGASPTDNQREEIPFEQNPSALNPDTNYVYSANNQPSSINGYEYPGYYLPSDRAARIVSLLEEKKKLSARDMETMLLDNTSDVAVEVVSRLKPILRNIKTNTIERDAINQLTEWKGTHNVNDVAPVIYHRIIDRILRNTFSDELGPERFNALLSTHLVKQILPALILNETSPWWDDSGTPLTESRDQILQKSFREAISSLVDQSGENTKKWKWGAVHTVEYKHPLGSVPIIGALFNVGPFEIAGGSEVIDNQFFAYLDNGLYNVHGGPSTRRLIDFSHIENSLGILPSGQSGNPFSRFYCDQARKYVSGGFRKMLLNRNEIQRVSTRLTLLPAAK